VEAQCKVAGFVRARRRLWVSTRPNLRFEYIGYGRGFFWFVECGRGGCCFGVVWILSAINFLHSYVIHI